MSLQSTARVATNHSTKYLQQLCMHWSHSLVVEFTSRQGVVIFPRDARGTDWPGNATLKMEAGDRTLECKLTASVEEQLATLKSVVANHIDRFAFREGPLRFDWYDAPQNP